MRGSRPGRALEAEVAEIVAPRAGETLVAAVSGGPDSAALAALAAAAAERAGARLILAHVNHGARRSAWQDEAVVLALGARLGLPVRTLPLGPYRGGEATMRAGRYRLLDEFARGAGARRLLAGHNADDQTETVLLALFRGTGMRGLGGMPAIRERPGRTTIVRPLLRIERARLARFCAWEQLPVVLDPTNLDPALRRNAVRSALAALRPFFPGLDEAVARCAELAREAANPAVRARLRSALHDELASRGAATDLTFARLDAAARALERELALATGRTAGDVPSTESVEWTKHTSSIGQRRRSRESKHPDGCGGTFSERDGL